MSEEKITRIDTSIMTEKVIRCSQGPLGFLNWKPDYRDKFMLLILENYSKAVQFAVRTHEFEQDTEAWDKFSRLQRGSENDTTETLENYYHLDARIFRKLMVIFFFFGAVFGSLTTWWLWG